VPLDIPIVCMKWEGSRAAAYPGDKMEIWVYWPEYGHRQVVGLSGPQEKEE